MSPTGSRLFSVFPEFLAALQSLGEAEFAALRTYATGPHAFDLDEMRVRNLADEIKLGAEATGHLIATVAFLYDQIGATELEEERLREVALQLITSLTDEEKFKDPVTVDRLIAILRKNPGADAFNKIQRLRSGFLKNAVGFSTFVDARPDFTADYQEIRGLVPVVQLRITTDSQDPTERSIVFQLDERGLLNLEKTIQTAKQKIDTLVGTPLFARLIVRR
jgi:hypothetical protein